jgi:hypothetical protein
MEKLAIRVGAASAALLVTFVAVWGAAMLAYPPDAASLATRPSAPSAATMHHRVRG